MPTLDEFIESAERRLLLSNTWVVEPGFSGLYVRLGPRIIAGVRHDRVLDLANIEAERPGSGAFTRLTRRLSGRGLSLYVENVQTQRFAAGLVRLGFT